MILTKMQYTMFPNTPLKVPINPSCAKINKRYQLAFYTFIDDCVGYCSYKSDWVSNLNIINYREE